MIEGTEDYAKSQETDDIQGSINNAAMGSGILAWVHGVVEVALGGLIWYEGTKDRSMSQ